MEMFDLHIFHSGIKPKAVCRVCHWDAPFFLLVCLCTSREGPGLQDQVRLRAVDY